MRSSRRDFLARSAQFGVLLGAGVPLLQACGGDEQRTTVTKGIADGLPPEKGPLRLVNFADYVNLDVISDFESQYGVKVEISTFDTDTEATTKLACRGRSRPTCTTRWRASRSETSSPAG